MSTKRKPNLAIVAVVALAWGLGFTAPAAAGGIKPKCMQTNTCVKVKAPEINAAAGVQAIALLSGVLLLVGERARRRKDLG